MSGCNFDICSECFKKAAAPAAAPAIAPSAVGPEHVPPPPPPPVFVPPPVPVYDYPILPHPVPPPHPLLDPYEEDGTIMSYYLSVKLWQITTLVLQGSHMPLVVISR